MEISFALALIIYCFCFIQQCIGEVEASDEGIEEGIVLRLYRNNSQYYEKATISHGEELFQESKGYNKTLPLVLLIHGIATGADCYFVNGLVDAFVKRRITERFNIFAVDMPELFENSLRNEFYLGILANVEPAGEAIGRLLSKAINQNLTSPEKIHIIGYSMGAQVAGYTARVVKESFGKINFIAGLDPAGPGFHTSWGGRAALVHVSAADAVITHFYHTNSISCGTSDRVATADFVFNKGTVQPGCTRDKGIDCSHVRVPHLYIEAVVNPKSFIARKCPDWEQFKTCSCNHNEKFSITFPPDTSAMGIYHIRTRAKSPFALGRRGSVCSKLIHIPNKKQAKELQAEVMKNIERIKKSMKLENKLKQSIKTHLLNGLKEINLHKFEVENKKNLMDSETEEV